MHSHILEQNFKAAREWLKCCCRGETQHTRSVLVLKHNVEFIQLINILSHDCLSYFNLPYKASLSKVADKLLKLYTANFLIYYCKAYSSLHSSTAYSLAHS